MSGSNIKTYSTEDLKTMTGQTDWSRLRNKGDHSGAEDEGIEADWARAEIVDLLPKRVLSIRLDQDVLDFFKTAGKGYQTRINAVLRAYVRAQKGTKP